MTAQEPWEEAVIEAVDLGREVSADRARDKQISIISTVIGRADLSPCLTAAAARKISKVAAEQTTDNRMTGFALTPVTQSGAREAAEKADPLKSLCFSLQQLGQLILTTATSAAAANHRLGACENSRNRRAARS
jgi:hypothetical protein